MNQELEEYLKKPYKMELVEDPDEGGYVVAFPELPGCISTGETVEEAIRNAKDAKHDWLIAAFEDQFPVPDPATDHQYSGQFKLRIPKSLHKSLANQARLEGVSMNQLCLYLLSKNFIRYQNSMEK